MPIINVEAEMSKAGTSNHRAAATLGADGGGSRHGGRGSRSQGLRFHMRVFFGTGV